MGRLQDILAGLMYFDRVDVVRQVPAEADDGSDDYTVQTIYENIPCKLSQYGKEQAGNKQDRAYVLHTDLRLCLAPEYEILPNDILVVTHEGQEFVLNAARAFVYPTHQEISVRRKDEA